MLWEPMRGLRRRSRPSERDEPSGEGLDYCAVRERELHTCGLRAGLSLLAGSAPVLGRELTVADLVGRLELR
jgi:hypothetical protein